MTKTEITEMLRKQDATVTFTVKDGTQRVMRCTLRPDALPEMITESTRTSTERRESDSTIAVWATQHMQKKSLMTLSPAYLAQPLEKAWV